MFALPLVLSVFLFQEYLFYRFTKTWVESREGKSFTGAMSTLKGDGTGKGAGKCERSNILIGKAS